MKRQPMIALALLVTLALGAPAWAQEDQEQDKAKAAEAASVAREVKIGQRVADEIAQNMELIQDPRVTTRVRMIFDKLTPGLQRPLPYNVQVLRLGMINAFCIPGGNVYVTTGLLDFVHGDAELASVLAHELIHAEGKHGIIQMERNQKLSLAALAIAIASRGQGAAVILSSLAQVAMSSSYSRDLEQQADQKGLKLLVDAGYPAVAALTVLEGMAAEELTMPWYDPGIYADHPSLAERIRYIQEQIVAMGHPVQRKRVLGLLKSSVSHQGERIQLSVDDVAILDLPSGPESLAWLQEVALRLDRDFHMELSPYDIRVITDYQGERGLYMGLAEIFSGPPPGQEAELDLEEIRSRLLTAQGNALKKHPIADYLG